MRPADLLEAEYEKLKEESKEFTKSEEDVLMYAMFPQVAQTYLEKKYHSAKQEERKEQYIHIVF